ncbi:MAG: SPFH domain-containing protein [Myxococcota bacterium]
MSEQKQAWRVNGFAMLAALFAAGGLFTWVFVTRIDALDHGGSPVPVLAAVAGWVVTGLLAPGLVALQPNEARVLLFFGKYIGSLDDSGFWWVNPLTIKRKVSMRVRNFNSEKLKVNDALGNPIEIGAVVVWSVTDPTRALLDVESYETFVAIQAESAIRTLAQRYPYDAHEEGHPSLRASPDEIAHELGKELQHKLGVCGVHVSDARITHLAYAPEIAQAMLRRQQAQAVIAARKQIVEGAVSMVQMALDRLAAQGVVELDEERKANMVSNLMVVLVSDNDAQPVINAGTLY